MAVVELHDEMAYGVRRSIAPHGQRPWPGDSFPASTVILPSGGPYPRDRPCRHGSDIRLLADSFFADCSFCNQIQRTVPEDISLLAIAHWSPLHLLIPLVVIQRIAELRVARRNEKLMRAEGAVEFGQNHYAAIVALHTLWFLGMIGEVVILTRPINPFWPALLLVVLLAQGLRYWAIRSLGTRWNTKILVLPKAKLVARGPYKYLKHPNYVAVVIELLVFPMIFSAYLTAITASLLNLYLLRIRIRAEESALRELGKGYEKVGGR